MTRRSLRCEIQSVNQRLNQRHNQFQLTSQQLKIVLKTQMPYFIIASGLLVGVVTGVMGWRKTYKAVITGYRFYPFLKNYSSHLMSNKQ